MPVIADMRMRRGRPERFLVTLDDGQELLLTPEIVLKFAIAPQREFPDEAFLKILEEDALRQAKDQALRYLAVRPHSRRELFRKMREKGYRPAVIERALADLAKIDLINDEQFARLFIQNELLLRPSGRTLLRQKLMQRGIEKEMVEHLLAELFPESLEEEFVRRLAKKFLKSRGHLPPQKQKEKLVRYLQGKGFGWDHIRLALALLDSAAETDDM